MSRDGVLLLGGGFLGGALAARLASEGRQVHLVSRNSSIAGQKNIAVHRGDLGDAALLGKLQPQCGTVIHLATVSTPSASAATPALELDNLLPTLRLLNVVQGWPDTHLVYLSSGGTVYGNPARNPVAEDAPLTPLSAYGAGKVAAEGFVHALRASGLAATILRPANAYGPRQNLQLGFGLVRTVLQHIRDGMPLDIWGDGENVRDFVYVDDVVQAMMLALNAPLDCGTYNVGSGSGHTINQVLEVARRVCGRPLSVNYHPSRSVDVREVVLDNSKIRAALGWQPKVSLEEGMQSTWQWLQAASGGHDA